MNIMETTKSVIVGYDHSNGKGKSVLIVGEKKKGQAVDIVNAFAGEEANELWTKLTTKKDAK